MPVVVWLRVLAGDIVEAAADVVSDVDADMAASGAPGSVLGRVGSGVDWRAAGRAAAPRGDMLGAGLKIAGPFAITAILDWFLDGAIRLLGTEAFAPSRAALAQLGDALLTVTARILRPLIPAALETIEALAPVAIVLASFLGAVVPPLMDALALTADVIRKCTALALDIVAGIGAIGRAIGETWAAITQALDGIAADINGAVESIPGLFAGVLRTVLDGILAPLRAALDVISDAWDEWIGRHLDELGKHLNTATGYMLNGMYWAWGTGPLGDQQRRDAGLQLVEHHATDAQLMAALRTYARDNGGLARALWAPA